METWGFHPRLFLLYYHCTCSQKDVCLQLIFEMYCLVSNSRHFNSTNIYKNGKNEQIHQFAM